MRGGGDPKFPDPNMVHFRNDRETYRRFAGELPMANPKLANVKQIGTDLDSAVFEGIGDIFQHASKRKYLQHIMERDAIKLQKWNATLKQKTSILGYIYESEQNHIFNVGLVDAEDLILKGSWISWKIFGNLVPDSLHGLKGKECLCSLNPPSILTWIENK